MGRTTWFAIWLIGGIALGATAPLESEALTETKLIPADAAAGDLNGSAVAIAGNIAVVGSSGDGSNAGSATVFRFDGANWTQEQKLVATGGTPGDSFGAAVAVSGDAIAVGAPFRDELGTLAGAAYIFRFDAGAGNWFQEQKLLAVDGGGGDLFGASVALSGSVAVIGAEGSDVITPGGGVAYVFEESAGVWSDAGKLIASDSASGDSFGFSVSVEGGVAAVGALGDNDNGTESGSAYIFRNNGVAWVQEDKLLATDGAAFDNFGFSIAISGSAAFVGASAHAHAGADAGAAYVFRFDGNVSWPQETELLASDGAAGDGFGTAVAASGATALVGSTFDDDLGADSGSAYLYKFNGTNWLEQPKLLASDGATVDHLGGSVGVSGDKALVGAPLDDDSGTDSGVPFIFAPEPSALALRAAGLAGLLSLYGAARRRAT